ncbi:MAG: hypothetical protein H6799_01770 [Candidatus Nomurabacteria bacterium]|nr:MAG: hypothetical protein H6799_01770 [Candidatus Nomurabacteria bacterium]HRV75905.1 hypothetical protein [Candidatus Saccharimonadales bacterium]
MSEIKRFTERDLNLWRRWMDEETHYARVIKGYGDDKQRWYFEQGVANPEVFSFKQSIMRYLQDAFSMRDLDINPIDFPERGRLKFVRALGKFSHNQIACLVTAHEVFYGGVADEIYPSTLDRLGALLEQVSTLDDPGQAFMDMDPQIQVAMDSQMLVLWDLQKSGDNDRFIAKLSSTALASSVAFVACSRYLGWCTPGLDSKGDEVFVPWNAAA